MSLIFLSGRKLLIFDTQDFFHLLACDRDIDSPPCILLFYIEI